ncbi:neutral zinc metallopeptidase [Microbispora hainanensis]|uniref:Peptidase n=1 Tax=Microbispora hainanensis TaxID=568844 RepID=A0A544YS90_9ACTN|nr:neutral zinc metallopeptidase [Microbispora hainanensis]TQS19392.1 peptidase [Microbispora hainanensis]
MPFQAAPFQVPPPPPPAPAQQPAPPQGPGWAPQPPPPPRGPAAPYPPAWRPPRRKSGAGAVIGALMGVLALVFVLVVVVSALAGLSNHDETVSPVAIPSFTFSPFPTDDATTDTEPTQQPTSKPTSQPTTRPKPVLNRTTKNNTVYRAGSLAKTNCRAGNASIYNHTQFKALILKTGTCMGKAWGPALERVGIDWSPPNYMIAARKGRGACGDYPSPGSNVPYYCPSNRTIYASTSAMAREYGPLGSWNGIIISMMAHEYGHHIQNITGISDSWWRQTLDSSSRSGRLTLSRRHELQATCFGGMFMQSVAASYPIDTTKRNTLLWAYSHLGDPPGGPRDHGNTRSNAAWFRQGYTRPKAYQCNTWVVGSSSVS